MRKRRWRSVWVALAVLAPAGMCAVGVALLSPARSGAQSGSCTVVNDLIASHPDYLQLEPGFYDNSCATLDVPNGYHLAGRGDSSLVILHHGGDAAQVGKGASVSGMKWVVAGAPNDVQDGVNPCPGCLGVRMLSHSEADHMRLQGSWLGFDIAADHVSITNSYSLKNGYGVLFDVGQSKGNAYLADDDLTGNATAGFGVQEYTEADSATIVHVHNGFSLHCWYALRANPNPHEYAVTNIDSVGESCEFPHGVGYDFGRRKTSGVWEQPHTSWAGADGAPMWESAAPLPGRSLGAQTLIVGAGGDGANGPLLGPMRVAL